MNVEQCQPLGSTPFMLIVSFSYVPVLSHRYYFRYTAPQH